MLPGTPKPGEVREQLGRILAHNTFVRSKSLSKLLQAIVEQTIEKQPGALKEVALASLLHADKDYNPSEHSNIRVAVSNLRRKLDRYYTSDGARDSVLIRVPTGSYVATFEFQTTRHRRPDRNKLLLVALTLVGGVAALTLFVALPWRKAPVPRFEPVQLTFDSGYSGEPSVSPDGETLAYASDRGQDGRVHIWIQRGDGPPRQLTDGPGQDFLPELSPDKRLVAYRSLGDGESLLIVQAAGGAPTLIAREAFSPRFSPDSRFLAYSAEFHIYVLDPVRGGVAQRVDSGAPEARCPIWTPGGRHVVFLNRDDAQQWDYWISPVPANGAPARRLGIQALLRRANLPLLGTSYDCPQDWIGDSLLFRVDGSDPASPITDAMSVGNAFRVRLAPPEWLPGASVEPLEPRLRTEGLRVARDRHWILFSADKKTRSIWSLSLNPPNSPAFFRALQDPSIRGGSEGTWPSLSADGDTVCAELERTGKPDIVCKNLKSMTEKVVGAEPVEGSFALPDADGRRVAFIRAGKGRSDLVVREVSSGAEHVISSECPVLLQGAADQSWFLCSQRLGQSGPLFRVSASTGAATRLLSFSHAPMFAQLSPDCQWVALVVDKNQNGILGGYVVSLRGNPDDPSAWIHVTDEPYQLSLHWGPDGDRLYFWQVRDGSRCLWGQHLDSRTKQLIGPPFPVLHRHGFKAYPNSGGTLAVAGSPERPRFAMTLADNLSNLWRVSFP